jgi:hypothetical protein
MSNIARPVVGCLLPFLAFADDSFIIEAPIANYDAAVAYGAIGNEYSCIENVCFLVVSCEKLAIQLVNAGIATSYELNSYLSNPIIPEYTPDEISTFSISPDFTPNDEYYNQQRHT